LGIVAGKLCLLCKDSDSSGKKRRKRKKKEKCILHVL